MFVCVCVCVLCVSCPATVSQLGYLVDLESAGALLALSFLPFLMALQRGKMRKDAERAALEDDAEAALEVGAQQTGIDASIN